MTTTNIPPTHGARHHLNITETRPKHDRATGTPLPSPEAGGRGSDGVQSPEECTVPSRYRYWGKYQQIVRQWSANWCEGQYLGSKRVTLNVHCKQYRCGTLSGASHVSTIMFGSRVVRLSFDFGWWSVARRVFWADRALGSYSCWIWQLALKFPQATSVCCTGQFKVISFGKCV